MFVSGREEEWMGIPTETTNDYRDFELPGSDGIELMKK
jgi:hypothetical protein